MMGSEAHLPHEIIENVADHAHRDKRGNIQYKWLKNYALVARSWAPVIRPLLFNTFVLPYDESEDGRGGQIVVARFLYFALHPYLCAHVKSLVICDTLPSLSMEDLVCWLPALFPHVCDLRIATTTDTRLFQGNAWLFPAVLAFPKLRHLHIAHQNGWDGPALPQPSPTNITLNKVGLQTDLTVTEYILKSIAKSDVSQLVHLEVCFDELVVKELKICYDILRAFSCLSHLHTRFQVFEVYDPFIWHIDHSPLNHKCLSKLRIEIELGADRPISLYLHSFLARLDLPALDFLEITVIVPGDLVSNTIFNLRFDPLSVTMLEHPRRFILSPISARAVRAVRVKIKLCGQGTIIAVDLPGFLELFGDAHERGVVTCEFPNSSDA